MQMKTISKAPLIVLLLACTSSAPANAQSADDPVIPIDSPQSVRFEHLTTEQGLSSDIVWGVVQDDHGFIWMGTLDGLNRYDGNTLKVYRYDPKDPNSLGDNSSGR
jgi:ligand-binding sensor domain-containing protein